MPEPPADRGGLVLVKGAEVVARPCASEQEGTPLPIVAEQRDSSVARAQLDPPLRGDLPRGLGQRRHVRSYGAAAFYFATSIERDSRITITLTWPGYSS